MKRLYLIFQPLILIITVIFIGVFGCFKTETAKSNTKFMYNNSNKPTIIIDAGHGGEDGGAVANDNTFEKDINLEIAKKLDKIAKANGYNTVLTRSEDIAIYDADKQGSLREKKVSDMKNRLKIMNETPNAVFISIHLNKFESQNVHGAQVFYSKNATGSKELAVNIQESIEQYLQTDNKKAVKENTDKIYLLKNADKPAVIVECGFLSNINDLNNLKNNEFQYKIALCIFFGIINSA